MEASAKEMRNAAIVDGAKDIAFGSVAGMVSKVFEHPFDLCKVRLQAQVLDASARFSGPVDCLVTTWRKEGVRGLYRGLPAPIVGAMAENATLFLTYGQLQRLCRWWSASSEADVLSTTQLVLSAAGAGAATSFLLTPIELVKCKMQVQLLSPSLSPSLSLSSTHTPKPNFTTLPGPLSILRSILHTHGPRGLWLGQTGTLIRETGGAVAWFGTKEAVCDFLLRRRGHLHDEEGGRKEVKAWESAVAGACAGVAYNVVLFPADSVKSALQTSDELRPSSSSSHSPSSNSSRAARRTFWGTARAMYTQKGVRGLYAGMGVTAARAIPSSALIFLIYDGLCKRFG